VYLMRRWVLDFLASKTSKATLKGEFVPYLLSKQFTARKAAKSADGGPPIEDLSDNSAAEKKKIEDFLVEDPWMESLKELSNACPVDQLPLPRASSVRCNAAFPSSEDFCVRVNTTASFCEVNKSILRLMPDLFQDAHSKSPTPEVIPAPRKSESESAPASSSRIQGDSLIGDGTKLGAKTIVKRSVIGKNCQIGDHVKIENSVLLDGVVVGDSSALNGVLALDETSIGTKAEIKDCLIGVGVVVDPSTKATNETLVKNMMEI